MNDSNRVPNGQLPGNQDFRRRMPGGLQGRGIQQQGFAFNNGERGFYPGRGPHGTMGRGRGPPPPPPRGRGGRFGPPPGRGYYPEHDKRFSDRGTPPMTVVFDHARGLIPPPPPPPPNQLHMGRGIPPPPPPKSNPGQWMPPPRVPIHISQQPSHTHTSPTHFNHYPQQHRHPQMIQNIPRRQHMTQPIHHAQSVHVVPNQPYNAVSQAHGISSALPPKPVAEAVPQAQIDLAWTVHSAPNSSKFYYNVITKESTFTKPQALTHSTEPEKAVEQPWTEYKDAKTGREYYSNGLITTWEKPVGFQASMTMEPEKRVDEPIRKKKKTNLTSLTEFANKSEAIAGFKGLLLSKDIQPTMKWNDVVRTCSSDARWEACSILTQGERKQALAEYQTRRANELRDLEREERMRAKDGFTKLLTDVLQTVNTFNPVSSRFGEMRDFLNKDDRFYAVEDEATRETLFLEFCEEVRKREERQRRNKRRDSHLSFLSFLREREESKELSFASTWSSFLSSLSDQSKSDPRFQPSEGMSESDRELYFSDCVIELQAAEDEKRRRIRDAKSRAEKAQREGYIEFLVGLAKQGTLRTMTKWRDVEVLLSGSPAFGLVKAQDRDSPRELFQDFMDEWIDMYRRDRVFLARLVKSSSLGIEGKVTNETSYDEFSKALLDAAAHSADQYSDLRLILKTEDPVSSVRIYFDELVNRVEEVAIAAMRRNNRRGSVRDDSSEDEGEIIEDAENEDDPASIARS